MGLSNKQRLMIMRKAKEMNYKGSLLDLFKEAEAGGFANDINKPAPAPYISKKSDFGISTTYEKGGIKKLKGEPIDNKSAIPGETISLRHGLDNMPNSFKDFLQKQHVLSSSDLEKKPEQMQNGGMGDGSQDAPTGSWEPANEGLYFKNMLMEHISKDRNADNVLRVMNDVAMFESNNDITAIQAPRKEGGKPGPARGKYQYEVEEDGSNSANTAVNRLVNFLVDIKGQSLKNIENNFPELHSQYVKKSADFTEFNSDFQDAFFLADNIYGGKDRAEIFNSVAKKKDLESIDVFRFWLKNHKAKLNGKTVDKLSKEEIDAKFLEWTNRVPEPEAVDKKEDGGLDRDMVKASNGAMVPKEMLKDYEKSLAKVRAEKFNTSPMLNETAASFLPGVGEIIDAKNTIKDLAKEDYLGAGLNAAGFVLPFVPGSLLKSAVKKTVKAQDPNTLYRVVDASGNVEAAKFGSTIPDVSTIGRRTGYKDIQKNTDFDVLNTTTNQNWIAGSGPDDPRSLLNTYGGKSPYIVKMSRSSPGEESLDVINSRTNILNDFNFPYTNNVGKWNSATGQFDLPLELGSGVYTTVGKNVDDLAKIPPGSIVNPNMVSRGNNNITTIFGPKGTKVRDVQGVMSKAEYLEAIKQDPTFKFNKGGYKSIKKYR